MRLVQPILISFQMLDLLLCPHASQERLNEQVSRNKKRFPEDFMFRLTNQEAESLRSQFATSKFQLEITICDLKI